jgi:hypothetical protein
VNDKYAYVHDFFVNEGFLALDRKNYPLLRKYNHCSLLQEKSAVIFLIWDSNIRYNNVVLYKIINECLCSVFLFGGETINWTIHRPQENDAYPLQPIIDTLCELCKKAGLPFLQIKFIDEHLLAEYQAIQGRAIQTTWSIDRSEYAYKTKDLVNLSGPDNYYKRKRVKKFIDLPDISIRPITNKNVQLCLEIEAAWCKNQDCSYCGSFAGCEKKALEALVDIFDDTFHTGLFLFSGEIPSGYIICEQINKKLSFLYCGKSTMDDGFIYLIYIMYRDFIIDSEYMNMNEDMGHQGLRKFKKLLSVHELWHKYVVTYELEI